MREDKPLVSVICASYNQSQYILESLESIKKQTFQDFELIIWDDASKDNSAEIIEEWIKKNTQYTVVFVKNTVNKGICASLNECFLLSRGKYIQLLALDDILLPWKLAQHVKILDKSYENEALVFTDAYLIDENATLYQNKFIAYHYNYLNITSGNHFDSLWRQNYIPGMSVLFKKSIIENEIGLWDVNLSFEDYDMWLRISRKFDFIFDPKPSVYYRLHNNNTHKKMSEVIRVETFEMRLKHSDVYYYYDALLKQVESLFLTNDLSGENRLFFSRHPANTILKRMIYRNSNRFFYRLLKYLGFSL